jgi:hypothetical protein
MKNLFLVYFSNKLCFTFESYCFFGYTLCSDVGLCLINTMILQPNHLRFSANHWAVHAEELNDLMISQATASGSCKLIWVQRPGLKWTYFTYNIPIYKWLQQFTSIHSVHNPLYHSCFDPWYSVIMDSLLGYRLSHQGLSQVQSVIANSLGCWLAGCPL